MSAPTSKGPPPGSPEAFGARVRTVRAFSGMSQTEFGRQLSTRFPSISGSCMSIKRLEKGGMVRGSYSEWSMWIEAVVGVPCRYFLETGEWPQPQTGPARGGPHQTSPDIELARHLLASLGRVLGVPIQEGAL